MLETKSKKFRAGGCRGRGPALGRRVKVSGGHAVKFFKIFEKGLLTNVKTSTEN